MEDLLDRAVVLGHPWVVGELALGQMRQREEVLGLLSRLPQAQVATTAELAVSSRGLASTGRASATSTPSCWLRRG